MNRGNIENYLHSSHKNPKPFSGLKDPQPEKRARRESAANSRVSVPSSTLLNGNPTNRCVPILPLSNDKALMNRIAKQILIETTSGNQTVESFVKQAINENDKNEVLNIIQKGIDIKSFKVEGLTLLHYAIKAEKDIVIMTLLENGANINAKDSNGCTPLHYAINTENYEILEKLIKEKANVNITDNEGLTPLHYIVKNNFVRAINVVLDSGADINAKDKEGFTALDYAMKRKYTNNSIIRTLRTRALGVNRHNEKRDETRISVNKTNPRKYDNERESAVKNGEGHVIEILAKTKTDLNAKDVAGWTPLMYAAANGQIDILRQLIFLGADIDIKNNEGKAAYNLTSNNECSEQIGRAHV